MESQNVYVAKAQDILRRLVAEQALSSKPVLEHELTIKRGGNGIVFIHQDVAFKTDWSSDKTKGSRKNTNLESEALMMSKIKHTNVIRFYGTFVWENELVFFRNDRSGRVVEEHIPAGKLFICMETVKPVNYTQQYLGLNRIIVIASKLTDALLYMHSMNVAHMDVNDNNILIRDGDYEPKLIDLGMATEKTVDVISPDGKRKKAQAFLQTEYTQRYHAPPEVFSHIFSPRITNNPHMVKDLAISGRYDAWSLGVYLFELLSKQELYNILSKNRYVPSTPEEEWTAINNFFETKINHPDQTVRKKKIHELLTSINPGWEGTTGFADELTYIIAGMLCADVSKRYQLHHINMMLNRLMYYRNPGGDILFPVANRLMYSETLHGALFAEDGEAMIQADNAKDRFSVRFAMASIVCTPNPRRLYATVVRSSSTVVWYSDKYPDVMVKTNIHDAHPFRESKLEIAFMSLTQIKHAKWFPQLQSWFLFYNGYATYDNELFGDEVGKEQSIERVYTCHSITHRVYPYDHEVNNNAARNLKLTLPNRCLLIVRNLLELFMFMHKPFEIESKDGLFIRYWALGNVSKESIWINWDHSEILVVDSHVTESENMENQYKDLAGLGELIKQIWAQALTFCAENEVLQLQIWDDLLTPSMNALSTHGPTALFSFHEKLTEIITERYINSY